MKWVADLWQKQCGHRGYCWSLATAAGRPVNSSETVTIYTTVYYIGLFRTVHKVSAVHHFLKPVNGLLLVTRAAIDIVIVAITHPCS